MHVRVKLDKSRTDFQTTQRLHRLERVKQFRQTSRLNNNDDDDDGGDSDNDGGGGGYGGSRFGFERERTASVTTQSSTLSFSTHRGSRGVVVERLAEQLDKVR